MRQQAVLGTLSAPIIISGGMIMVRVMTDGLLENYKSYLREQEKSKATIQKYMCDLNKLVQFVGD